MSRYLRHLAVVTAVSLIVALGLPNTALATADPAPIAGGEVVVKLQPGVDIRTFADEWGLDVVDEMLASREIYLVTVPFDASNVKEKDIEKKRDEQAKKVAKDLEKSDDVVYAEPNFDLTVTGGRLHLWERPGSVSTATELQYLYQPAAFVLQLASAHKRSQGSGTTIAVLDTGIDLDHEAFAGRIHPGYDYIDDDAWPDDVGDGIDSDADGDVDEGVGHGTRVAGLAHLVAPEAKLLPARVLDSEGRGNVYVMAEAITDVVNAGVTVINISAGVESEKSSDVLADAIKFADDNGVVVVAAAGNSGSGAKTYPASDDKVISVGTINRGYSFAPRLAWFSNHGKWVTVATPGVNVVTVSPGGYVYATGTSMSAPMVAGQVSLLRSFDQDAKANDVRKAVEDSADKIDQGAKVERGAIDIAAALDRIS